MIWINDNRKFYKASYRNIIIRSFQTFLEYIFGMKFKVTGDTIDYDRPAVIIMNHRTRLDWMYFWAALFKINPWLLISSKIALKAELRHIPAAGFLIF